MSRPFSTESVFRAIAHPTRRRILEMLRQRERTAGDFIQEMKHSRPTLSRHLQILRATGLIAFRRRRTALVYRVNKPALQMVGVWAKAFE